MSCVLASFSARTFRGALARAGVWSVLVAVALGAGPLAAQTPPPPVGDRDLPVSVAGDLLDDAFAQEVGVSQPAVLRRSRAGKIGVAVALAALLLGMRFLYRTRRPSPARTTEPDVESVVEPSVAERSHRARRERPDGSGAGERRSHRPYRSRDKEGSAPLALPPHVLAILSRTRGPDGPAVEGEAAPYHASDKASAPATPDEPPEQRLDLVIPGFTPWRNGK